MVLSLSLQLWFRLPTVFQGVIFQDVTISDGCCVTSIEPKKKAFPLHVAWANFILTWTRRVAWLYAVPALLQSSWCVPSYLSCDIVYTNECSDMFFQLWITAKIFKTVSTADAERFFFVPSRNKKKESLTRCDSITRVSDHWFVFPLHMLDHSQWSWVECWHENCAKLST